MEENQSLNKRHLSLKASLSAQEIFFQNFFVSSIDEHEEVISRLDHINMMCTKFNDLQSEIEFFQENLDNEREVFEDQYFRVVDAVTSESI